MRYIDILSAFETEIGLINNTVEKPSVDDSLFWINQSVGKFVKLRFNGDLVHGTGYEQTEKRRQDLIRLFTQVVYGLIDVTIDLDDSDEEDSGNGSNGDSEDSTNRPHKPGHHKPHHKHPCDSEEDIDDSEENFEDQDLVESEDVTDDENTDIEEETPIEPNDPTEPNEQFPIEYRSTQANYDQYIIKYPSDFLYALNEDVVICDNDDKHIMDTCVFECTQDSFMYRVNNSLTDFHYRFHRARPIRIRNAKGCNLLTDKNYKIKQYTLGYLRKPKDITLQNPFDEYTDFEDVTMSEIIKIAAQMYLENTGNQRYKTISEEVLTQE